MLRYILVGNRRIQLNSWWHSEQSNNTLLLSIHKILLYIYHNLQTNILDAWQDQASYLNSRPLYVAVNIDDNVRSNTSQEF